MALDRVKSVSALSPHSPVKGLIGTHSAAKGLSARNHCKEDMVKKKCTSLLLSELGA